MAEPTAQPPGPKAIRWPRAPGAIGRLVDPVIRLVALASVCLLPAAAALYTRNERLAVVAGALAIAAYYVVVLRSATAARLLHQGAPASPSSASP